MTKSLAAIAAAAVMGLGALTTTPTPASAHAWWVVPAIVGGVLVGGAVIASTAHAYPYGYAGPGRVYVEPTCRTVRERTPYGIRRVRVCN